MKYNKPQITKTAIASYAIMNNSQAKIGGSVDSLQQSGFVTDPAYSADE
jgi:hypothetical protein